MRLAHTTGVLAAGAALLALAAGCGSSTAGDPQPSTHGSTSTGREPSTVESTSPSASSDSGSLASMQPCDLLSQSDLQKIGFSEPGHPVTYLKTPSCRWGQGTTTITAGIRAHHGLGSFDLSKEEGAQPAESITIEGHPAKQQLSIRDCAVGIGVSPSSRVDVLVTTEKKSQWCAGARQVATLVARHLPKS